jgi:hypothetical protein
MLDTVFDSPAAAQIVPSANSAFTRLASLFPKDEYKIQAVNFHHNGIHQIALDLINYVLFNCPDDAESYAIRSKILQSLAFPTQCVSEQYAKFVVMTDTVLYLIYLAEDYLFEQHEYHKAHDFALKASQSPHNINHIVQIWQLLYITSLLLKQDTSHYRQLIASSLSSLPSLSSAPPGSASSLSSALALPPLPSLSSLPSLSPLSSLLGRSALDIYQPVFLHHVSKIVELNIALYRLLNKQAKSKIKSIEQHWRHYLFNSPHLVDVHTLVAIHHKQDNWALLQNSYFHRLAHFKDVRRLVHATLPSDNFSQLTACHGHVVFPSLHPDAPSKQ